MAAGLHSTMAEPTGELPYGLGVFVGEYEAKTIRRVASDDAAVFAKEFAELANYGDTEMLVHILRERREWCRACLPEIRRRCYALHGTWGYEWACRVLGEPVRLVECTAIELASWCADCSYDVALRAAMTPEVVAAAIAILAADDAAVDAGEEDGEPYVSDGRRWLTALQSGMALRPPTKPARYPEAPA